MTVQELIDILSKHAANSLATQALPVGITINDHFYEFSNITQEYVNQNQDITFFSIDAKRTTQITKVLCFNKLIDNSKQSTKSTKSAKSKKTKDKAKTENLETAIDDDSYVEF